MSDDPIASPDPSDKYDQNVMDDADILNDRDLNINPNQYIHIAIQRSQLALLNPNMEAGLVQYIFIVQQIELVCRSSRIIDEASYLSDVDKFKRTDFYKNEKRELYQMMNVAQEKLRLLLTEVFNNKVSSAPLKM